MTNFSRDELNSIIHIQQNLMKILFCTIKKMIDSLDITSSHHSNTLLDLLNKSKNSLKACNENMNLINDIISCYNNSSENLLTIYETNIIKINNNTIIIEDYIYDSINFFDLSIQPKISNINNTSISLNNPENAKSDIPDFIETRKNTLIISETTGNIILPYSINDLKNKNKSYEQIIDEFYTLPIDSFKPAFIARFRETFKLAHYKEKKSVIFSLNLATELMFNYNLHPAIITACRNLDELDIYLDCLENNETEKFKCFNIIFEVPPILSQKSSKL